MVAVGRVAGSHGIRGELNVEPLTDWPERIQDIRSVFLSGDGGGWRGVERARMAGSHSRRRAIVKLGGVDDRDAADACLNRLLSIRRTECRPLEDGSFYIFELVGSRVFTSAGEFLGTVKDVLRLPSHQVLVVERRGGEILIPLAKAVVKEILPGEGKVVIEPIEGLLEP